MSHQPRAWRRMGERPKKVGRHTIPKFSPAFHPGLDRSELDCAIFSAFVVSLEARLLQPQTYLHCYSLAPCVLSRNRPSPSSARLCSSVSVSVSVFRSCFRSCFPFWLSVVTVQCKSASTIDSESIESVISHPPPARGPPQRPPAASRPQQAARGLQQVRTCMQPTRPIGWGAERVTSTAAVTFQLASGRRTSGEGGLLLLGGNDWAAAWWS